MLNPFVLEYQNLRLTIIPMRSDNYSYLLESPSTHEALLIDPSEGEALLKILNDKKIQLTHLVNTHHHSDHIDGNVLLKSQFASKIYASSYDAEQKRIPGGVDVPLKEGNTLPFAGQCFEIIETPGHTLGHISLFLKGANWLFTGDTLFSLGCGRLFEGNPEMLWTSFQKYRRLPEETLVFSGHEYTLSNARFIESLELQLKGFTIYHEELTTRRDQEGKTIPTKLGDEFQFNPYFLTANEKFRGFGTDEVDVFAKIRSRKDKF